MPFPSIARYGTIPRKKRLRFVCKGFLLVGMARRQAHKRRLETGILFDQSRPCLKRRSTPIIVSDDWPELVPVTEAELRIFEAFFADFLDELLRSSDKRS